MAVNAAWIDELGKQSDLATRSHIDVHGVAVELPVGGRKKGSMWQRRVSDDVLPDSPNADAPEKTPSQILRALTDPEEPENMLSDVLSEGELSVLAPLFLYETRGKSSIPVGFHVLATRAVKRKINSRAFTERTFKLLMRDEGGELDVDLVRDFVEYFRAPLSDLDLAQRTVLQRVQADWDSGRHHLFLSPETYGPTPFIPEAGALLRRDLRRLLDAKLSRADFFRYVNRLLALHFGLYQPRLASVLNPAMRFLEDELAKAGSVDVDAMASIERGEHPAYRFEGSILTQAPSAGDWRPMRSDSPTLLAYRNVVRELNELHFSLMVLNRIRELGHGWLIGRHDYESDAAAAVTRHPSWFAKRLRQEEGFREYFETALEALCVRFIHNQIAETSRDAALSDVRSARSGLSALFDLYRRYNREASSRPSSARSVKQGEGVLRRLLRTGESGLLRARRGLGGYFELGAGLLPLLLLTTMDTGVDKLSVQRFWREIERYGIYLEPNEQERVLLRLKSMGLYERYSDAGSASYVRSMLAPAEVVS